MEFLKSYGPLLPHQVIWQDQNRSRRCVHPYRPVYCQALSHDIEFSHHAETI